MLQNAIRAMRLEADFYETVEADPTFQGQAFAIVMITAFMAGMGDWLGPGDGSLGSAIATVVAAMIMWVIWSAVTLFVGTRLFGGTSNFGEMSRVLGFATAPRALLIIPWLGWLVGGIWMIAAGFVAVRQGLDFSGGKALGTVLLGIIPAAILYGIAISIVF